MPRFCHRTTHLHPERIVRNSPNRGDCRKGVRGNTDDVPRRLTAALAAAAVVASVGVAVQLRTTTARAAGTGASAHSDRWALVVGITDYAGSTHSTVAGAEDAADFREVLLRNGFRPD